MKHRLCIVPRWGGGQDSEWYPWLRARDDVRAAFAEVLGPRIEDPGTPTIEAWVASLTAACGADGDALARTYFVGHSVGCQAIVRYLASLPAGTRVAGCVLVAAWWNVDQPWDTIRPWMHPDHSPAAPPLELARVRAACERFEVLLSDNDPFTADWRATQAEWEARVGARVQLVPGARHFNATEAPDVARALLALIK